MQYAFAGWPIAGRTESQLERWTRQIRSGAKKVIELIFNPLREALCNSI
ncbi:protease FtsH-inhibitory lysogeny factor CIII [Cedecea neteri]|nr:protease FtsH-inhibitory lysogeny factor CIII [Cedecea neteri]WNJ77795.1 protease FtsH-inhibitory lysogeny factor CIII [Cedecea neteri]